MPPPHRLDPSTSVHPIWAAVLVLFSLIHNSPLADTNTFDGTLRL